MNILPKTAPSISGRKVVPLGYDGPGREPQKNDKLVHSAPSPGRFSFWKSTEQRVQEGPAGRLVPQAKLLVAAYLSDDELGGTAWGRAFGMPIPRRVFESPRQSGILEVVNPTAQGLTKRTDAPSAGRIVYVGFSTDAYPALVVHRLVNAVTLYMANVPPEFSCEYGMKSIKFNEFEGGKGISFCYVFPETQFSEPDVELILQREALKNAGVHLWNPPLPREHKFAQPLSDFIGAQGAVLLRRRGGSERLDIVRVDEMTVEKGGRIKGKLTRIGHDPMFSDRESFTLGPDEPGLSRLPFSTFAIESPLRSLMSGDMGPGDSVNVFGHSLKLHNSQDNVDPWTLRLHLALENHVPESARVLAKNMGAVSWRLNSSEIPLPLTRAGTERDTKASGCTIELAIDNRLKNSTNSLDKLHLRQTDAHGNPLFLYQWAQQAPLTLLDQVDPGPGKADKGEIRAWRPSAKNSLTFCVTGSKERPDIRLFNVETFEQIELTRALLGSTSVSEQDKRPLLNQKAWLCHVPIPAPDDFPKLTTEQEALLPTPPRDQKGLPDDDDGVNPWSSSTAASTSTSSSTSTAVSTSASTRFKQPSIEVPLKELATLGAVRGQALRVTVGGSALPGEVYYEGVSKDKAGKDYLTVSCFSPMDKATEDALRSVAVRVVPVEISGGQIHYFSIPWA